MSIKNLVHGFEDEVLFYDIIKTGNIAGMVDQKEGNNYMKNGVYTSPIFSCDEDIVSSTLHGNFMIIFKPEILNTVKWSAYLTECGGGLFTSTQYNIQTLREYIRISCDKINKNKMGEEEGEEEGEEDRGEVLLETELLTNIFDYVDFILLRSLTFIDYLDINLIEQLMILPDETYKWFCSKLRIDGGLGGRFRFPLEQNEETINFIQHVDFYRSIFIVDVSDIKTRKIFDDAFIPIPPETLKICITGKELQEYELLDLHRTQVTSCGDILKIL